MGCLTDNIINLSLTQLCEFNTAGIKRLWVASYISSTIEELFGVVTNMTPTPIWVEILVKSDAKYSETYDFTAKKYKKTFEFTIKKTDFNKRESIDALLKSKLYIAYEDKNGLYHFDNVSFKAVEYALTQSFDVDNSYFIKFEAFSNNQNYAIDPGLILNNTSKNCDVLNTELVLSSNLVLNVYYDCMVGDLIGWVDPI